VISETAVHYVAAVYGVAWVVILAYVVILNAKLGRLERQLDELASLMPAGRADEPERDAPALTDLVQGRRADA
jgi:CcmD family protein